MAGQQDLAHHLEDLWGLLHHLEEPFGGSAEPSAPFGGSMGPIAPFGGSMGPIAPRKPRKIDSRHMGKHNTSGDLVCKGLIKAPLTPMFPTPENTRGF